MATTTPVDRFYLRLPTDVIALKDQKPVTARGYSRSRSAVGYSITRDDKVGRFLHPALGALFTSNLTVIISDRYAFT